MRFLYLTTSRLSVVSSFPSFMDKDHGTLIFDHIAE